jgi:nucleotide-binding universal stress UspA family protein
MAGQKVLLAYNFTPYDQKSLDFVARTFLGRGDVEITLFNAYTPVPHLDTKDTQVVDRMKGNIHYLYQKIDEQREVLRAAVESLVERGFQPHQVRSVFRPRKKDIATEIIEYAREERYAVVIVNRKPGRVTRFFTGNVFSKVVSGLQDTVICVVS